MAFKPQNAGRTGGGDFEPRNLPTPKTGPRQARVSLIVDLGVQIRKDFEDEKTGETRPQKPCHQLAVFADLVRDVVDYGGNIGKAQYRMLLNKDFGGVIEGINFAMVPPKDGKGNIIQNKPWTLHPANMLSKLAKATENEGVIESGDVEELLNQAFMIDIEVVEKEADKKDDNGNPIVFKYVRNKGVSKIPMVDSDDLDEDGNPVEVKATVPELKAPAKLVTFETATKEDIKVIRKKLIDMIKLAENYAGSNMQKAIEAYEADKPAAASAGDSSGEDKEAKPTDKPKATPKTSKATPKKPVAQDNMDDDVPF